MRTQILKHRVNVPKEMEFLEMYDPREIEILEMFDHSLKLVLKID